MSGNSSYANSGLKICWPIALAGAFLGLFLSWGVISGDSQGRVNLMHLLLVYLVIPLLGFVFSLFSLGNQRVFNFARLLSYLPITGKTLTSQIRHLRQFGADSWWFVYQSQIAALCFSIASLVVLLVMLLITDVSFVWRSTLLDAEDIYPVLKLVALPWYFIEQAQPSLELLQLTQDSRLQSSYQAPQSYAQWWFFVFAVQVFYCLILRSLMLVLAASLYRRKLAQDFENQLQSNNVSAGQSSMPSSAVNALVEHELPHGIQLVNWFNLDMSLIQPFLRFELKPEKILAAGPFANKTEQMVAERWQGQLLVVVKAWEPPMAELADFLSSGQGLVFPIDWREGGAIPVASHHLAEWQRFASGLENWQIFLPESLMPHVENNHGGPS